GAQVILLEAAELIGDDPAVAKAVEAVIQRIGLDKVMFELPGPWIEGVTHESIHRMRRQLVDQYGPEVNIGNVEPSDLISLEAYRRGLGVNAGQKSP
ncbi:MAG: phosphosulfolactate synthase, partial [Candidatus Latescibacteria bacterium]|nr:phosphosulfolactate synthase [Candidatus Latescibacterota bacterium]